MEGLNEKVKILKEVISRKSWTAYVIPLLMLFVLLTVLVWFDPMLGIMPVFFAVLVVLNIRSYKLYLDADGVWIDSGIFPWSKGSHGVKWRDLDEAVYFTGFISWALKSYKIQISHRFTKDSEIILSDMKVGDVAVSLINSRHRDYVAANGSA